MKVLVACERSGIVRDAFRTLGHDAWSCDTEPCEKGPDFHLLADIELLLGADWGFDLLIAHPPCTYLCSSGLHWNGRTPGRSQKTEAALAFVAGLWAAPIKRKCLENPVGCINTRLPSMPKPQYVQPHDFGHDASKKTGLWLEGLPRLVPTQRVPGRIVVHNGKFVERWANQTDSGQNRLGPSAARMMERARTYQGIADAMAAQWGGIEA